MKIEYKLKAPKICLGIELITKTTLAKNLKYKINMEKEAIKIGLLELNLIDVKEGSTT